MTHVLIVDDDLAFAEELASYLENNGFRASVCEEPSRVMDPANLDGVDAILLDKRMPDVNGLDILRNLRSVSSLPCILLTGASDEIDKIVSLEVGADDHVSKSWQPRELVARLRAVLRRSGRAQASFTTLAAAAVPAAGWIFSEEKRELFRPDGSACQLTTAEFEVLRLLVRAQGKTVTREEICRQAFNRPYRAGDRAADMIIVRLRRILEAAKGEPRVLKSVRPLGYVFTGFPSPGDMSASPNQARDVLVA